MEVPGSPVSVMRSMVSSWPQKGQVGVVLGRAGLGKSTVLVHLGVEQMLKKVQVMHLVLGQQVDGARAHYDEILRSLGDRSVEALVIVQRHRMIHSAANGKFDPQQFELHLDMLAKAAQFVPELIIVDGLDEGLDSVHALVSLAKRRGVVVWATLCTQRKLDVVASGGATCGVRLVESAGGIQMVSDKPGGGLVRCEERLDSSTLSVSGTMVPDVQSKVVAREVTLYSGGAKGCEATFGLTAERHGVEEVNFTFNGHRQERTVGRYTLSPKELAAGDVSLKYVSRRLNRTYNQDSGLIRGVLQTIWHMVSRSSQVFVIGSIQTDNTVQGGTGWAVELARTWGRELWVFDQPTAAWNQWDGESWVPGTPVIASAHIAGTGTRKPSSAAIVAIEELFSRSF